MKKMFNTLLLLVLSFGIFSFVQPGSDLPHIQFQSESHDFGVMTVGDNGTYQFKFTNTGKTPLIIQEVRTSCGCTIAKKPSEPIMPGASSVIEVNYDTRRLGVFHKYITVTSNADNSSINLSIQGDIKEKPAEEVPVAPIKQGFTPVAK